MSKVRWKTIEDYPNYEVSTMGQVRNKKTGRILVPYDNGTGYMRVKLYHNGKCRDVFVHVIVATTFLLRPKGDNLEVNHKFGNKKDNRLSQLEWLSHSDNVKHAWATGLRR